MIVRRKHAGTCPGFMSIGLVVQTSQDVVVVEILIEMVVFAHLIGGLDDLLLDGGTGDLFVGEIFMEAGFCCCRQFLDGDALASVIQVVYDRQDTEKKSGEGQKEEI